MKIGIKNIRFRDVCAKIKNTGANSIMQCYIEDQNLNIEIKVGEEKI